MSLIVIASIIVTNIPPILCQPHWYNTSQGMKRILDFQVRSHQSASEQTQLHSILPVQGLRGDSCGSRSLLVITAGRSHIPHSRWISYHTQQVRLTSHTAGGSHITHSRWVSHHMLQVGLISQRAGGSHITHIGETWIMYTGREHVTEAQY